MRPIWFSKRAALNVLAAGAVLGLGACASDSEMADEEMSGDEESVELSEDSSAGEEQALPADAVPSEGETQSAVVKEANEASTNKINLTESASEEESSASDSMASSVKMNPVTRDSEGQSSGGSYSGSKKVSVQTTPFQKQGYWMNAFYFVRGNEASWEKLSAKLYGRPDRAALLKEWNSKMGVGSVVYYNSPARPDDSQNMKPFAMDFGSSLDKLTIQRGESLSTIAQRLYGDAKLWREISALNPEIEQPDQVKVGQEIVVQPAQVDSQQFLNQIIAKASEPSSTPTPSEAVAPVVDPSTTPETADMASLPPETPAPDMAQAEPPPATAPPEQAPAQDTAVAPTATDSSSGFMSFLGAGDESSTTFLIGAGLIVLALLFVIRARRRKAAEQQELENNLSNFPSSKTGS